MFLADRFITIHEKEKYPITEELIEKLDEMLTQYNIQHFFSLPISNLDGTAADDEVVSISYESKDEVTVELIICLWSRIHRNYEQEMIYKAFSKKIKKLEEKEF